MSTALTVYDESAKTATELEALEQSIIENDKARYEAGFSIAVDLERIKAKKLHKRDAGIKTWGAYCKSGRLPRKYSVRYADRLITALTYRRALPKIGPIGPISIEWSEGNVRPLTTLSTPAVAKQCAKAAIARYKKMSQDDRKKTSFSKVVAEQVAITKNTKKEQIAKYTDQKKALHDARLCQNLRRIEKHIRNTAIALADYTEEDWTAAEAEAPGICSRVATVLEELAAFLRE